MIVNTLVEAETGEEKWATDLGVAIRQVCRGAGSTVFGRLFRGARRDGANGKYGDAARLDSQAGRRPRR